MQIAYNLSGTVTVPDETTIDGRTLYLATGETIKMWNAFELNENKDLSYEEKKALGICDLDGECTIEEVAVPFDLNLVHEAITTGKCLEIIYDGKPKTVEVHAYGLSSKAPHDPVLRVFQVAGESSRPLPSWAMLKVPSITSLNLSHISSEGPRPGYKMGDSHMSTIFKELKL